ncbi:biotin/lipoyl-binding protein, partial [Rhizobium sp. PEPV16]
MKRIFPIAILLLVAAGAAAWWYGLPEKLGWLPEARREFVLYGNVDIRQVSLGFRVSGRLAELHADEGDVIKSGDVLANLDAAPY